MTQILLTPKEIREFQDGALDWWGRPLVIDGVAGPKTRWALAVGGLPLRRYKAVTRAVMHVGVEEARGDNRHPLIDRWVTRCGAPLGSPWCAAWLSWVLSVDAVSEIKVAGARRLGQCYEPVLLGWRVQAADIIWFPVREPPGAGHCELVIGADTTDDWGPETLLATVGGNVRNGCRAIMRKRGEVEVSRPFRDELGEQVPLPRNDHGLPALPYLKAHGVGARFNTR